MDTDRAHFLKVKYTVKHRRQGRGYQRLEFFDGNAHCEAELQPRKRTSLIPMAH